MAQRIFFHLNRSRNTYKDAKEALTAHLFPKKNLTAERYRFFCTKPTSPEETHGHWITRFRTKGKDCEFDNMTLDEAIKLVVTLHTPSGELHAINARRKDIFVWFVSLNHTNNTTNQLNNFNNRHVVRMKTHKLHTSSTI